MRVVVLSLVCVLGLAGCEDTDVRLAGEAGLDAVKAVALSDEDVQNLAEQAAQYTDSKNRIAPVGSEYGARLHRLVGERPQGDGLTFDCKVYLTPEINAFAMADGTIRIYSGLMDMMDDRELLFVVGHEMGHVSKRHIRQKLRLAYAGSALRKGIASQRNVVGDIARSQLGAFAERLMNAQFSQQEEMEADNFGLAFLKNKGHGPHGAISALRKLAALGNDHSFLSSHPAPGKRADRLEGAPEPQEGGLRDSINAIVSHLKRWLSPFWHRLFPSQAS